jgi:hypothetical protein
LIFGTLGEFPYRQSLVTAAIVCIANCAAICVESLANWVRPQAFVVEYRCSAFGNLVERNRVNGPGGTNVNGIGIVVC